MNTTAKVLLSLVGGCAVLILFVIGMGAWFWHRHGKAFIADTQQAMKEGERRGESSDENGCLEYSIKQQRNASLAESVRVNVELSACLNASRPSADFCVDVPAPNQLFKVGAWSVERCRKFDLQSSQCSSMFQQLVRYCASPERQKKLAEARTN